MSVARQSRSAAGRALRHRLAGRALARALALTPLLGAGAAGAAGALGASGAVSVAHAQTTVALNGRVTTAGRPLAEAQVAVTNLETRQQRGTRTTEGGTYTIVGLQPGSYEVRALRVGYAPARREVRLLVGQRATLDFEMLEAATALAGVEITAAPRVTFEAQRTDVSTPVVQAEIENLPLNTRNTLNLAAIVPGIKTFAPTAGRSLPAAGALPDLRFYNFYLDGVEWKSMFNGNLVGIPQTGSPIPQEALREFRVHLNPYDAELTRGGSYIINAVTQQGTNEFKGSAFVYGQNNDVRALDEFQRRSRAANPETYRRADYTRQQLGFNLRGPIVRDRAFFAASYELGNTTDAIQVVPGRPAFNPGVWDQFARDYSAPTKNHTGVLRLTAPVGEKHTLDAIWAGRFYDSETFFGGTAAHEAGIRAKYQVHSVQLRDTYTPTGSLVNQFSLHLLTWDHNESPLSTDPVRNYPSIFFGRGGFPLVLAERHWRAIDKISYTLPGGRHVMSAGTELTRVRTSSYLPSNQYGVFDYRTDTSTVPFRGTVGVGFFDPNSTEDARAVTDGWVTGLYLQDQWQATADLTLNVGLRYDAELNTLNNDFEVPWATDTALNNKPALQGFLNRGDRKNDLNNLAPRFSFTWDVFGNDKTFLRGGYGIMYGRVPTTYAFSEKQNAAWRSYEFQNPGTTDPAVLRQRVIQGGVTIRPSITLVSTDIETPETRQISAGVGQAISNNFVANLDYVNQRGRKLYASRAINPLLQVTPTTTRRALTPNYGNITVWDDIGESSFQAVTAGLTYDRGGNPRKPLRLSLAYTLGFYEASFEGLGGYANLSSFDVQRTTGDERHRLVLSGITPLPFGFQLSGIVIGATPRPFEVTDGRDLNGNNLFGDDWVGGTRIRRLATTWETMYRTVDLRLSRALPLGAAGRLHLSAEMFNVFDWTNWSSYGGQIGDRTGNALASFGQPTGAFAPRQAQLGVRYQF
ncbi:MAG: TonB-dependent receptor [Gemmatimonadaceae bacterium]